MKYSRLWSLLSWSIGIAYFSAHPLFAATFTVTSTSDPGSGSCTLSSCSLRDAISAANSNPGSDTIAFTISGSGVQTIRPNSALPTVTDAVILDGTTQTPSSSTPTIELRGDLASSDGLRISASNCTVKGFIINRFGGSGILISGAGNNTIASNWIGVDSTGLSAAGNALYGIELSNSANNLIGGSSASARNVISGNGSYGIYVGDTASSANQIKGNYIGTDYQGALAIGNTGGISLKSSNNIIGGSSSGEGNVITGLGLFGLYQINLTESDSNTILGNYIGTNAAGNASLSQDDEGIYMGVGIYIQDGKNNTIGAPGAGNLISGNGTGIELRGGFTDGLTTSGNVIQSNYIGPNAAGDAAIPNYNGIVVFAAILNPVSSNTIGGVNSDTTMYGNLISGNGTGQGTGRGIQMIGPLVYDNTIQGNFIGTTADGTTALGNTGPGILLSVTNNQIGGAGAGNVIAHNGETAVTILDGTQNRISQNRMFGNAGLGIDAGMLFGANPVDSGDADQGPNNFQNFPEFGVTIPSKGKILAKGELDSTPLQTFTLEFFLNSSVDDSGYGEGDTYLGSEIVLTDANGKANFSRVFAGTLSKGGSVTATATDSIGNTSEFSLSVQPTGDLKPGKKIEKPPVVAIVDEVVTISLPLFRAPKEKKKGAALAAAKSIKTSVLYEVTLKTTLGSTIERRLSKRNILTFKELPSGSYQTTYRAQLKQGKKAVAKTRLSPTKSFTLSE